MEPLTIENNLEHWEIPTSDIYPRPSNVVPATTTVNGSTVTLTFDNLQPNCRYVVVLTPELEGQDGSCADFEAYYFTSTYSPLYCSYQSVLSLTTVFSEYLSPHLTYQAIVEAGTQADMLTYQGAMGVGTSMNNYVRSLPIPVEVTNYTKYEAAYLLTMQMATWKAFLAGEIKELNDFRVTYGQNALAKMLEFFYRQTEYWRIAMVGEPKSRWVVKHGMMVPTGLPMPPWMRRPLGRPETVVGLEGPYAGQFGGSNPY
jgi:hypothetical protein